MNEANRFRCAISAERKFDMKTKKFKRVLTLVLALAMLFALSMSAFATGATVVIRRPSQSDIEFQVQSGVSVKQALLSYNSTIVNQYGQGMTANFTGDYLTSLLGLSSSEITTTEQAFVESILWSYLGHDPDVYWLSSGFGFYDGTGTDYYYVYAGYDWVYWIEKADNTIVEPNGIVMDDYIIQEGDTVVINYDLYVTVFNDDPTSGERIYPLYP